MTTPAVNAPPAKMTYEEFLEAVDEDTHAEWVNGEMVMTSPVSDDHQDLGLFLLNALSLYVHRNRLGVIRYESYQMKTGPGLPGREPDILFIAEQNRSRLRGTYLDGPADLVVEIISKESFVRDRGDKFREYEEGGVREYWALDRQRRRAEFHQLDANGLFVPMSPDANGIYNSAVLNGLWLRVDWLWQTPLPDVLDVLQEWGLL